MTVPRYRDYQGWPVFSAGFRPFFLAGAIQAGVAILVWLPVFYGELRLTSAFAPRDWHVHEMLYGYLPAVMTGFLFTAIPNWTGRLPVRGAPLLVQILVFFYVVADAAGLQNRYVAGVLILSFFSGAYITEIIRAGIRSGGGLRHEPGDDCAQ